MNDRLGTDTHHPVRVTDERVLACLDGAAPDIGALWELCVYLEWDRAETLEGITAWLGPPEQLRVRLSVRLVPGSTNRGVLAGQVVPDRCGWCGLRGELVLE
jgi:hypothetical protein